MKFVLPLFLALTSDVLAQPRPTSGSLTNPPGCPVITCVMFCTDGLQKDEKGCDKCSCVRGTGKLATGTTSCKRDADGCCYELGYAKCPEQGICLSTAPNAVVPCKSWGNNPPMTGVTTPPQVFTSGAGPAAPLTKPALATVRPLPAAQAIPLTLTGANFQQTSPSSGLSASVTSPSLSLSTSVTVGGLTATVPSGCSDVMCAMYCPNGFQKDSRGCNLCACASAIPALPLTPAVPSGCSDVMCAMYCPNGFQKDSRGCNLCACASLTVGGVCAPVDCGGNTCAGGFSKDKQGCPTCICLAGAVPALPVTAPPKPLPTSTSSDPCKPNPCSSNQKCVPEPKQCVKAPCPQYRCSSSGVSSGTRAGKKGKKGQKK